jgi:hypothetical protein
MVGYYGDQLENPTRGRQSSCSRAFLIALQKIDLGRLKPRVDQDVFLPN